MEKGRWFVQLADGSEDTGSILSFLLEEYCRIFGEDVMYNQDCLVYNDAQSSCPRFKHTSPLSIRLKQSKLSYWSQTIYQLSHELGHYALYQRQTEEQKKIYLSWFEEIVCGALSLYALSYAWRCWNKCKLYRINPGFADNHKKYLNDLLSERSSDEFARCDTLGKLEEYEQKRYAEKFRSSQGFEVVRLYKVIMDNPNELKCLLDYPKYIEDNKITINFNKWIKDNPCRLLKELKLIQPVK